MGLAGGIADPDRALQARDLQTGRRRSGFFCLCLAPVVMIHGAFCGPWSLLCLGEKFREAGHAVTSPCLRFHDGGKPPAALGTTSLLDYVADLEEDIAALKTPPILVGHSMGGLLAQMLAARIKTRALVLLAPSAPWGVAPPTLFEISAAQALHLNPGYWTKVLEPSRV